MAQWLWLRAFQTVHYRITLKKNSIFLHNFLQIFFQNYFILIFFFFSIFLYFLQPKKKKLNSLLTIWYALRPSQQGTVSRNYSQSIKINIGPSDGGTIVPSSHCPNVLYWRLSDFYIKSQNWNVHLCPSINYYQK